MGRVTALNGNGRAVLPPTAAPPIARYRQPVRTRTGWARVGRVLLWLLALVVMLSAGSAGGAYLYFHESIKAVSAHSKDVRIAAKRLDLALPGQPAIALVVGYDKRKGKEAEITGSRSDTIMLLRADPASRSISMLSFPRDLSTQLWCGDKIVGTDRINGAYGACGSKGTLDTVRHLTGLSINYLVTVDFHGFKDIVDRVGGVWVDVDRRYYNKNVGSPETNFADIDLHTGYQKLNGQHALEYVRFRHTDSDLYRIARQQQFVKGLKQQISKNFSALTALRIVGAITKNVEVGKGGGGALSENEVRSYALLAYDLPAGHFFQAKINGIQGTDVLEASPTDIANAVQDFTNPDVEAPEKATAVSLGAKVAKLKTPPPSRVTVNVLNGNGVIGSATNAAYELGRRGYQVVVPPNAADRNAPTFDYFHTKVYYDRHAGSQAAAHAVAALFGDAQVLQLPPDLLRLSYGANVTVIVGSTFHGALAPAPVDHTPKKEPPAVRTDPGQTVALLKSVHKKVPFRLMVPHVIEKTSSIDSEEPMRVYSLKKHERAVRLTFLASSEASEYWGIEETAWQDAPVLQQPNAEHTLKGRKYGFYFNGPHLHMVVLREGGATYWVVNTLLDSLSNETMIAIAKGLQPLR